MSHNRQFTHHENSNSSQKKRIIVICDGVTGPANLGGLFRLCDAFGVEEMLIGTASPDLDSPRLQKTARHTQRLVSHRVIDDTAKAISELKKNNFYVLGLEITSQSFSINKVDISNKPALVLVLGGESDGISKKVLELMDATVHIDMYGTNSSMNVTQAAAIALFELSKT